MDLKFRRNPDYWGRDLPFNRGQHNFDEIRYEYFRDSTVALWSILMFESWLNAQRF